MAAPKSARNDFWLIAPYGWGSQENMIRVQKDEASTALQAIELAEKEGERSAEGYTLREELANHQESNLFVYECKEAGEYKPSARWTRVK